MLYALCPLAKHLKQTETIKTYKTICLPALHCVRSDVHTSVDPVWAVKMRRKI